MRKEEKHFGKDALLVSIGLALVIVLYEIVSRCIGGF